MKLGIASTWVQRMAWTLAARVMASRGPDKIIGDDYLRRWYIIPRNPILNVYLHEYTGSDDDRALHDHPWPSLSLMLLGEVREHDHHGHRDIGGGEWRLRGARYAHRLELRTQAAMTLFITGPRIRSWGFHCPQGWRHWRDFVDPNDTGRRGRGCE